MTPDICKGALVKKNNANALAYPVIFKTGQLEGDNFANAT
jgi:hypothetical protein